MVGRRARRTVLRSAVGAGVGAVAARLARRGRRGAAVAAVTGAAAGAAQEWSWAAVSAPLAAAAFRRDPLAATAGAGLAVASRGVWPVAPRHGAELHPRRVPEGEPAPSADGSGVRFVVNPAAGWGPPLTDELRAALPGATVVELAPGQDVVEVLAAGDDDTVAVGAVGGDGTLNAAAGVALDRGVPLVAVPAGTLNHLARDLDVASVDDAVAAVRAGTVVHMDVGLLDGQPFLNTASFGGYTELVDARERLERRVGKWAALLVALVRVLRRSVPLPVELDGRRRQVWLVFVGNCRYAPEGFGPSWRERLDDGLLDIRLVDGGHPWARTRLVLAVLTGTLARSAPYEEWTCERLTVRSVDGPLRVALDGETRDAGRDVVITKRRRALAVAVPPRT